MVSLEQPGTVSLWVFCEPEDPADVGKDVLRVLCGVDYYDLDQQEGVVRDEPLAVRSLLDQLSYAASFGADAAAAAQKLGIAKAYGVLAQFDFAYDPRLVSRPIARDPTFLGCFPWHE
jgi:hypothetical protein